MRFIYIERIEDVIKAHDKVIAISGGLSGVKNIGYIDSVIYQIRNDDYYPEFEDKLTHLVFSVNKFHAFQDGNKRSSIAVGGLFLELNGFDYVGSRFIREMENITVCVAEDIIDKEMLGELIYSIIYEDDFPEELKIRLTHSLLRAQALKLLKLDDEDDVAFEDMF